MMNEHAGFESYLVFETKHSLHCSTLALQRKRIQRNLTRKSLRSGSFAHRKQHEIFIKRNLGFRKPHQIVKSENYVNLLSLQASNLAPASGNLLVLLRVSPGRMRRMCY